MTTRHPVVPIAPALLGVALALAVPSSLCAQPYDLVLAGARVLDPETGLDAVRSVGISAGTIRAISEDALEGRRTIDAKGLAVAPGFIDMNTYQHGDPFFRLRALDGTTTVLNLEQGALDVAAYYDQLAGKALIHHGTAVGHLLVRMKVTGDANHREGAVHDLYPTEATRNRALTDEELAELGRGIECGLRDGAVAVGLGIEYAPGAKQSEILAMFRLAAAHGAPAHVHMRGYDETRDWDDIYEILGGAVASGAAIHITHLNSSAGSYTKECLGVLANARSLGLPVTTECYPYAAGMTGIDSAIFDGWEQKSDADFARLEWSETGERLTRESFVRFRKQGGFVILHRADEAAHEEQLAACVSDPFAIVASDGAWDGGKTHPRSAGTNSRVLGRYVRERGAGSLLQALAKLSLLPARHFEGRIPAMRKKGRVQVGADADLVLFDPSKVIDRATYREPLLPPAGIHTVIVAGVPIVRDGKVQDGVFPGRPVRAPAQAAQAPPCSDAWSTGSFPGSSLP
jgi:N-acyl-D-aspartate/D-glutamate deacylase